MKDYAKELGRFLEVYVNTNSISFWREDPHVFASRIFTFFSSLFFPCTEDHFLEGLKEKALNSLWVLVLDDIIEYTGEGKDNIFDSLQTLTKYRDGMDFSGKTETSQIMHDFIQRFYSFPSGPNKRIAEELLFLDIAREINAFNYERINQESNTANTLCEYMEFGAATFNMRVPLDIDIALYPHNLNPSLIGELREAYKWSGLALKLSSDIATFEREFFVEESNNAVILYGQEKGVLPRDIFKVDQGHKESFYESAIPLLMNDIEEKGRECLSKSIGCLDKISEIDMGGIAQAFTSLFENYPGQRTYSSPVKKEVMS